MLERLEQLLLLLLLFLLTTAILLAQVEACLELAVQPLGGEQGTRKGEQVSKIERRPLF